jgi:hypothetical protein
VTGSVEDCFGLDDLEMKKKKGGGEESGVSTTKSGEERERCLVFGLKVGVSVIIKLNMYPR